MLKFTPERRRYLAYLNQNELKQGMIVQVVKIAFHDEEHLGDIHNWENNLNEAPWAFVSGGLLVWLVEDWQPENLDTIKDGYFVEMRNGESLTIKKENVNENCVR